MNIYGRGIATDGNMNTNRVANVSSYSIDQPRDNEVVVDNGDSSDILAIRRNITRVLNMYFENVTDKFGYGAAATTTVWESVSTTSIPTSNELQKNSNQIQNAHSATALQGSTSQSHVSSTMTTVQRVLQSSKSELFDTVKNLSSYADLAVPEAAAAGPSFSNASHSVGNTLNTTVPSIAPSITYPSYAIGNLENCSASFASYTLPQNHSFCNWTWDKYLCWPPTPAGVLARMHCPPVWPGIDTRKFANRKCDSNGQWGGRPNETYNPLGWTDYQPCFKPEVNELLQQLQQMKNLEVYLDIAKRTRVLEIVGLVLSLLALILSLVIFCNFRSLRNNRTKIHKNLFIAMVLQVVVRLTLYLDQAFRRGSQELTSKSNVQGIENTPYLCQASYVLLEYARTAMFMWMFIEGLYLHNMVTVTVFQGRFPHTIFSLLGWGMPVLVTSIWSACMGIYTDSVSDCWSNYNLTNYYWIMEGPRLVVILLNFFFLMNILRVLIVKLRQSQASDLEQTRKAVRAAIVLLPLLGITNLLHLVPTLHDAWKFALWSYVTHFLTSFQGFFIAMIYCFLNGEVRTAILKSISVYMSVRGHPEWAPKRASIFSGAYNTAAETEAQAAHQTAKRNNNSAQSRVINSRRASTTVAATTCRVSSTQLKQNNHMLQEVSPQSNNNCDNVALASSLDAANYAVSDDTSRRIKRSKAHWMITLCFRGQKVLRVPAPASSVPPESVVFELSEH